MAVAAPDSPRSSESPPPTEIQREIEEELSGLANALFNLGTTVVSDLTKERERTGGAKPVGARVCVAISARPVALELIGGRVGMMCRMRSGASTGSRTTSGR